MRKLRVLISAYACNPAGNPHLHPGEDLVGWHLIDQLKKYHELWVISHAYNRPEIDHVLKSDNLEGVHFVFIKLPTFMRLLYKVSFGERVYYYLWQIAAWRMAVRLHREYHFDLAHHLTFGNYWMPSFIGAFLPIPFVWGPIGGGQKIPRVFLKEFTFQEKLSEYGRDAAQWIGRTLLLSRKICMHRARAILVCNRETRAMFPMRYWKKIQYFPVNGISRQALASKTVAAKKRGIIHCITAGRFIRLKGFDIVLKAFASFLKYGFRAVLDVVGQGPEEAVLRSLGRRLSLSDSVRFITWLSRADLFKRMRRSDIFLFSSFRDGGGAVVVEAMASGIPVVCLDVGGPGFHVHKEWGIKILPDRPDEVVKRFAVALKRLSENPAERLAMGRAGRTRAEQFYIWDRLAVRISNIYRKAMHENRTKAPAKK
jgi:glycosyltransferase involved in cell wall biosynthesis